MYHYSRIITRGSIPSYESWLLVEHVHRLAARPKKHKILTTNTWFFLKEKPPKYKKKRITPCRLTWNQQITHLERKILFQTSMRTCSMLIFRGVFVTFRSLLMKPGFRIKPLDTPDGSKRCVEVFVECSKPKEDFPAENLETLKFSWRIHYRSFRPKKSISSLKLTANGTLKIGLNAPKRKGSSSNHWFSGSNCFSFREGNF